VSAAPVAIRQAVAAMRAEDARLTGEIAELLKQRDEVRGALAQTCKVFGVTVDVPGRSSARRGPERATGGRHQAGAVEAPILAALKDGPLTPRDLAQRVGLTVPVLRRRLTYLEADGSITVTGRTHDRLVRLAGDPAKEAP
jgi:predicted Rossmann fold nucleotide-binding protein DprA/Smf involved in DNA uptake